MLPEATTFAFKRPSPPSVNPLDRRRMKPLVPLGPRACTLSPSSTRWRLGARRLAIPSVRPLVLAPQFIGLLVYLVIASTRSRASDRTRWKQVQVTAIGGWMGSAIATFEHR